MGWPRARPGTCGQPGAPLPAWPGSEVPGRSSLPGRAGNNPKRAGSGSFLQEFPAPHTSPGLPLPLTKYGAERPPGAPRRLRGWHPRPAGWEGDPSAPGRARRGQPPVPRGSQLLPARGFTDRVKDVGRPLPGSVLGTRPSLIQQTLPQPRGRVMVGPLLIPPFCR